MFKWRNLPKGFLMGIVELVPGVSSGTMALLLGIYDQFLGAISRIVSKYYKQALAFLLPLVIGMAIAILTMSSVLNYFLQNHTIPTHWFFMGMVLGVIPMMIRISNVKAEFRIIHFILIFAGIAILFIMSMFNADAPPASNAGMAAGDLLKYFITGALAASMMLLPGISGSLVMLILGVYPIVIYAINEFTSLNFTVLPILISTGLGIVTGVLLASRVISHFLKNYTYLTYAAIIGLLFGSVFAIYPGLPASGTSWFLSVILFLSGLFISYIFGKQQNKNDTP
ncbi:DUF368 domain-containing protein [Jeotgalicoccus halotolerans]|jgi:Predicted membrane protein|uniref:DUF368 domain-containing protein n=1 Tax=Jeotgalicoccus nanhaiensis TaxID=568603 RepID=A0ABR9XXV7_9STAP|nr:DUF368 domain-containing protein [Jeotgalicoccus nanhaiensis]MBF0753814.1 DUF368 domain-containing protein [Jeotgalicoccus nanhaiensis]TFU61976.1 DUF368 domain-containing protein [Jeotgalicoccus nanhaiensis]